MIELRDQILKEIPELKKCFQCGTCVSSCPAKIYSGHFSPREFILKCLQGMQSNVLNDDLYRCITCNNCNERCPQDVNPYEVIVKLKNIAVREKLLSEEKLKQVMGEFEHLLETGVAYSVTDLTKKKREELGLEPKAYLSIDVATECIVQGGKTRLRPVLLTAITTVLGLISLAIGVNLDFGTMLSRFDPQFFIGGDMVAFWGPISWTVIFGLTFATFLTLIIVPVMYRLTVIIQKQFLKWFSPGTLEKQN